MDPCLSVDKLAFTADLPVTFWATFRKRMAKFGDPCRAGKLYRESLEVGDPQRGLKGILVQWSPYGGRRMPFVRVEWNPNKASGWEAFLENEVRPFLRGGWKGTHLTRIDPAVDYPTPLQAHCYFAGNFKGDVHYSHEGIETMYLGSPRSNLRMRIYDKRRELEVTGEPAPDHPLTRIEAQKRSTGMSLRDLSRVKDPFERLKIAKIVPREGLRFKYRCFLEKAEQWGIDAVLKQVTPWERKVMKGILELMPPEIEHPSRVWRQEFTTLCRERFSCFAV